MKKVYRSTEDRVLTGTCAGIGEYFGIDPKLIRLAYILLGFVCGGGLLLYFISALMIPERPVSESGTRYDGGEL